MKNNLNIPVLMYHEIVKSNNDFQTFKMTPMYYINIEMFEAQIRALYTLGYKSVDFTEVENSKNKKKVIITFDDGWSGNYNFALPILQKYNFKAIFFVSVDSIGLQNYMTWNQLKKLSDSGMIIQSHCLSHEPLETLNGQRIKRELLVSKKIIEQKLNIKVNSLSFPHGSYNKKIINMAQQSGYKFVCCSNILFNKTFNHKINLIGRITMNSSMTINQLILLVNYKKPLIYKNIITKFIKSTIRSTIGINNYRRVYRMIFNIQEPEATK